MTTRPAVLVTGAAGYVGRLLLAALAARRSDLSALVAIDWADVAAADRLEGVDYVQADICDAALAQLCQRHGIDTIVHLASILRAPKNAPRDFAFRVDVRGTQNVLEACASANVKRLIVTSSGAAYGYHADNPEWLDEDDPLRGNDEFEYSRHKRLIEEMLARWRSERPALQQVVFRPGTILGESVRSPVTALFEQPFVLGVMGWPSPFVFIWDQDLVACLVEAIFSAKTGIYNAAGDGALTPQQIARILDKPYLALPAPLLKAALWLLHGLGLSEHGANHVMFLQHRPVLSNRRLKQDFGFTPRLSSREAFELYARSRHD